MRDKICNSFKIWNFEYRSSEDKFSIVSYDIRWFHKGYNTILLSDKTDNSMGTIKNNMLLINNIKRIMRINTQNLKNCNKQSVLKSLK